MRFVLVPSALLFACGAQPAPTVNVPIGAATSAAPVVTPTLSAHAKILDRLLHAPTSMRIGRGIALPLPDESAWREVDFWLVPSVMSVQYGDASDFHAILGAFLVKVQNANEPGACERSFLAYATKWLGAFDSEATPEKSWAGWWMRPVWSPKRIILREERVPIQGAYIFGRVMTLVAHGTYSSAYAVYPAWETTCLAIGLAVPNRDDATPQARALRDRFLKEMLEHVRVFAYAPPSEEEHH
jgi:hypothetical protein